MRAKKQFHKIMLIDISCNFNEKFLNISTIFIDNKSVEIVEFRNSKATLERSVIMDRLTDKDILSSLSKLKTPK